PPDRAVTAREPRRGRWRRWWAGRTLRMRMALVVGVAAAIVLLALARLGVGLLESSLLASADAELGQQADTAVTQLARGMAAGAVAESELRIVDTAGQPVDGRPALPLTP